MKKSLKRTFLAGFVAAIIVVCFIFATSMYTSNVLVRKLEDYAISLSELNELRYEFGELDTLINTYLNGGSEDDLVSLKKLDENLLSICSDVNNQYSSSDDDVQSSLAVSIYSNYSKYSQQINELINSSDRESALQLYNDKYSKNNGYISNYIEKLISYRYETSEDTLDDTDKKVSIFKVINTIALAVLFVILSILGVITFKRVIAPVEKLTRQLKQISNYNFDIKIDKLDTQDEIASLFDMFRNMKENLKRLFETNEKNIQMTDNLLAQIEGNEYLRSFVQQQKDVNDEIFRQANIDYLTGMMNKNAFIHCAKDDIRQCKLNMSCAVFAIEINDYASISDKLYDGADELLKITARKLNIIFNEDGYAARWEKGMFTGFIVNINSADMVEEICKNIKSSLNMQFKYKKTSQLVSVSIGAYLCSAPQNAEKMVEVAFEELKKVKSGIKQDFSVVVN
jgi:diguanylate cyclase (GGDEF)-like protein